MTAPVTAPFTIQPVLLPADPDEITSESAHVQSEVALPEATIPVCQSQAIASSQPVASSPRPSFAEELSIFGSTFLTIFLAELGDKTQFTTLLMSAESQSPWVVFAGAGMALVLTSVLGILLGRWLATRVPPKTLDIAAGMMLLLISGMLFLDVLKG